MAKAVFLVPFLLLLFSESILTKELSSKHSDKSNPNNKLLHEEKHKVILTNKAHLQQNRNQIQRCQITCPFVFPPPENVNGNANHSVAVKPTTSAPSTTASTTEEPTTDSEEYIDETDEETEAPTNNSTGASKNITSRFNKATKHGFSQTFRIAPSKELKNALGHGGRKSTYHRLTNRQKHILLKQLNLGNRHGKKSYKFRQINPYQCQVVCQVECEEDGYPSVAQPISSQDQDGDSDNEDGYVDGEDTPIVITVGPLPPHNNVIAGIRPIGNVDFIGMDDFGPSADVVGDPSMILEEKRRRESRKRKLTQKATGAEKRN